MIPLWWTECCSRQKKKKILIIIFLIPIINLSASRQNHSSENRDASKNQLFSHPYLVATNQENGLQSQVLYGP